MKKVSLLIAIMLCLAGCGKAETVSEAEVVTTEQSLKEAAEPAVVIDRTDDYKLASYEEFRGRTKDMFFDDDGCFDMATFVERAGCEYAVKGSEIAIRPCDYNDASDFEIVLDVTPALGIVTGDTIYSAWDGDNFLMSERYEQATDYTTTLLLGDETAEIGYDELNRLWRRIRLFTAPDDKYDEINAEVNAEIEAEG